MQQTSNPSAIDIQQSLALQTSTNQSPLSISLVGAGGKTHLAYFLAKHFKVQGKCVCMTTTTKMYLPNLTHVDTLEPFSHLQSKQPSVFESKKTINFIYQEQLDNPGDTQIKVSGVNFSQLDWLYEHTNFECYVVEADGAKQLPLKAPARHEPCIHPLTQVVFAVTGAEALLQPAKPEQIHRWQQFSALTGCLANAPVDEEILAALLTSPDGLFKHTPAVAKRIWVINKMDCTSNPKAIIDLAKQLFEKIPALSSVWLTQLNSEQPVQLLLSR